MTGGKALSSLHSPHLLPWFFWMIIVQCVAKLYGLVSDFISAKGHFWAAFVNALCRPDTLSILYPLEALKIENEWYKFENNRNYGFWVIALGFNKEY